MVTLRRLRYLETPARHRHFGRAAEECAVMQPAVSMQIRDLERELGTDLLERRANAFDMRRKTLLKDGHCQRDQALAVCGALQGEPMKKFGATSLATVADGRNRLWRDTGSGNRCQRRGGREERIKLIRFAEPAVIVPSNGERLTI